MSYVPFGTYVPLGTNVWGKVRKNDVDLSNTEMRDICDQILDIVLLNPGIAWERIYGMLRTPVGLTEEALNRQLFFFPFRSSIVRGLGFVLGIETSGPPWLKLMQDSEGVKCYVIDEKEYQKDTKKTSSGSAHVKWMYANGKLEALCPFNEHPFAEAERRRNFAYAQEISKESFLGEKFRRPDPLRQAEMDREARDNWNQQSGSVLSRQGPQF